MFYEIHHNKPSKLEYYYFHKYSFLYFLNFFLTFLAVLTVEFKIQMFIKYTNFHSLILRIVPKISLLI